MKYLVRLSLLLTMCCVCNIEASDDIKKEIQILKVARHFLEREYRIAEQEQQDPIIIQQLQDRWGNVENQILLKKSELSILLDPNLQEYVVGQRELQRRAEVDHLESILQEAHNELIASDNQ